MSQPEPTFRRVILKISGESLCPPREFGVHREPLERVAREVAEVAGMGVEVAIVVGGGNFLRGAKFAEQLGISASTADYMGMLATVLNALALREVLEQQNQPAEVQSALTIARACEPYDRRVCLRHLRDGHVVILAGGTGNPHVTTDSGASIRGIELGVDVLLKGTKVDGVYDSDPVANPDAKLFTDVTYEQVINNRLRVMDIGAAEMCERYGLPVVVFNLFKPHTLKRIVLGERLGTRMGPG